MDEQERMIQRFVDQELSVQERLELMRALDADPQLRRRLINAGLLAVQAAQLPRLSPSPRFAAQVMARLDLPKPSPWRRFMAWVTAPRTLQWNVASAVMAGLAVLGLLWVIEHAVPTPRQLEPAAVQQTGEPRVLVRLVLLQPQAQSVAVAGDFNGWNAERTPLQRTEGGLWTATIPLKPGRYQYLFLIDGKQWMIDPLANEAAGDGFGSQNAVLDIENGV